MASNLQSLVVRAPGMYGLNSEGETYADAPVFAEVAENIAYDSSGRLTNRKGFNALTTTANRIGRTALGSDPIATVINNTVATSAVNTSTNRITISSHGYSTTAAVVYYSKGGTVLSPLVNGTTYYVISVDSNTISLATSSSDATAGTVISLTGTGNNSQQIGANQPARITITHSSHGASTGDYVTLSGATATGGITAVQINIRKKITKVNANSYTFYSDGEATSAASGGGSSVIAFLEPTIDQLFMFKKNDGNDYLISIANNKIYESAGTAFNSPTDRTGSLSFTTTALQFVTFNNKCVADIPGQTMAVSSGAGNFAAISAAVKDYTVTTSLVNIKDNTIVLGTHDLKTGDMVEYEDSGGTVLGGLSADTIYYVIKVDEFRIKLATTNANAVNGTEIDLTGTGNNSQKLEELTAVATVPTGGVVHSAFGRLWAQKSTSTTGKNIISYSRLLDETNWGYTYGGEIDLTANFAAIAGGYDDLVAISSFDNYLVAFLRNNIILYSNPDDPFNLAIEQIITGVGCIARDSVQNIGNDIYFLSATGVRSLRQSIYAGNKAELRDISTLVRRNFLVDVASSEAALPQIKSNYDPEEGQYWLKSPNGDIWVFDMHSLDPQAPIRITKYTDTLWDSFTYNEGETYIGSCGMVGKYSGYSDDAPTDSGTYSCIWRSNPVDFGSSKLKVLKKITAALIGNTTDNVVITYAFTEGGSGEVSFTLGNERGNSRGTGDTASGAQGKWGTSEWNVAEWGGGSETVYNLSSSVQHSGRALKLGSRFTSNGFRIAIEQFSLFVKLGREGR